MSGPKMIINPKKILPGANFSRPSGCNTLAAKLDPKALLCAMVMGNHATRRLATRNFLKQARAWAKTPEGKQAMADKGGKQ